MCDASAGPAVSPELAAAPAPARPDSLLVAWVFPSPELASGCDVFLSVRHDSSSRSKRSHTLERLSCSTSSAGQSDHLPSAMLSPQPRLPHRWSGGPGAGTTADSPLHPGWTTYGVPSMSGRNGLVCDCSTGCESSDFHRLQQLNCRQSDLQHFEGLFLCL